MGDKQATNLPIPFHDILVALLNVWISLPEQAYKATASSQRSWRGVLVAPNGGNFGKQSVKLEETSKNWVEK